MDPLEDNAPESAATDVRLVLAYDAARDILKTQDTTLANVRGRANNVLAAAALLTSFSAGIGLINTDENKGPVLPKPGALSLLACLVVIGALVLFVLWPARRWHFGPHPGAMLERRKQGDNENELRAFVLDSMITGVAENSKAILWRQRSLRLAVVTLLVEVILLVYLLVINT